MSDSQNKLESQNDALMELDTKDIPSVYCNQAAISMSFNDIRIFLVEAIPANVNLGQGSRKMKRRETLIKPSVSLIVSPEFARNLAESISGHLKSMPKYLGRYERSRK